MLLPQTAEYALRAAAVLTVAGKDNPQKAVDIANRAHIPRHYVSKVLRKLVLAELLTAQKGHHGGFMLAKDPSEISLIEVLEPFGVVPGNNRCSFGFDKCSDKQPCPMHNVWSAYVDQFCHWAKTTTLADLRSDDPRINGQTR